MNFLIPMVTMKIKTNSETYTLLEKVLYKCEDMSSFVFYNQDFCSYYDVEIELKNIVPVRYSGNTYYFLYPSKVYDNKTILIKNANRDIVVSFGVDVFVSIKDKVLVNKQNINVEYQQYEVVDGVLYLYFIGKRKFVVCIKNEDLLFADFYDEYNVEGNEKYFMKRQRDSLNHGKVYSVKNGTFETYLVYLDDNDLMLKSEFIGCVFLDCVLSENFKYCNEMLLSPLKLKNEKDIKTFFPNFDYFYPINDKEFILLKKNTLAGICKFEFDCNSISNIAIR